jgi:hypothetical protein
LVCSPQSIPGELFFCDAPLGGALYMIIQAWIVSGPTF